MLASDNLRVVLEGRLVGLTFPESILKELSTSGLVYELPQRVLEAI